MGYRTRILRGKKMTELYKILDLDGSYGVYNTLVRGTVCVCPTNEEAQRCLDLLVEDSKKQWNAPRSTQKPPQEPPPLDCKGKARQRTAKAEERTERKAERLRGSRRRVREAESVKG